VPVEWGRINVDMTYPATEKHIRKARKQEFFMVRLPLPCQACRSSQQPRLQEKEQSADRAQAVSWPLHRPCCFLLMYRTALLHCSRYLSTVDPG